MNDRQATIIKRMGLSLPLSPEAVAPWDKWLIVNKQVNRVVEGHPSEERAKYWLASLNEHAARYEHDAQYTVIALDESMNKP